jgi:monofunctional chorismate mutase
MPVNQEEKKAEATLAEIRKEIDRIDSEITELINDRLNLVRQISDIKDELHLPTLDANREKIVLEKVVAKAKDAGSSHIITEVYQLLLKLSKEQQELKRGAKNNNA